MRKLPHAALILCFLLSIIYQWAYVYGMELLGFTVNELHGFELTKLIIIAILSFILLVKISYSELALKSLTFIVLLDAIWNVAQFLCNGECQGPLELLNALIFIPWLAYAWIRSYEEKSAIPVSGKVYLAVHKPDEFWGFVLSLKGKPVGGAGIWMDGVAYKFHRGEFKAFTKLPEGTIYIETSIKQTEGIEEYLKSKVDSRWGVYPWRFNNCLTTLWKVKHA